MNQNPKIIPNKPEHPEKAPGREKPTIPRRIPDSPKEPIKAPVEVPPGKPIEVPPGKPVEVPPTEKEEPIKEPGSHNLDGSVYF